MIRRLVCIAMCIGLLAGAVGCSRSDGIPKVYVTADSEKIECPPLEGAGDAWNPDRIFAPFFNGEYEQDIPYIRHGTRLQLHFGSNPPDQISVSDRLLNTDGSGKYTQKEIKGISMEVENNEYGFTLGKHMASMLSSEYKPGKKELRGFAIEAKWGSKIQVLGFVIMTDAS